MSNADRWLTRLMQVNAALLLPAIVPIFFPADLMATMNDRLGLEPFPRTPLTDYLTRSAAAGYALHGGMILLLATDVRRYRPLLPWVYRMHLAFAATIVGIDLAAGIPMWWTVAEGGTIAAVAMAVLLALRRTDREMR